MIIIAPDKFKGTLTADEAARAIAEGLREAGVTEELRLCPMADGGDGTAEVLRKLTDASVCVVETHALIGPQCYDCEAPKRSSHALGTALKEALSEGSRVLVGIGGTACCDGGAGMLQALGLRAYGSDGREITAPLCPENIPAVSAVCCAGLPDGRGSIVALSDVRATLTPQTDSQRLSALDFALQKGFERDYLPRLAQTLEHWHSLVAPGRESAIDGAGGGIGFALGTVLGAKIRSGAEFVADCYKMPFGEARLVISGEGRIDEQSGAGKVVGEMWRRAQVHGTEFLAIGGSVAARQPYPTLAVDKANAAAPTSGSEAAARLRNAVACYFKKSNTF